MKIKVPTIRCNCKHEFQDKMYGYGQRVFTESKPDSQGHTMKRCTVCGKEHD